MTPTVEPAGVRLADRTFDTLVQRLMIDEQVMRDHEHATLSKGEVRTIIAARQQLAEMRGVLLSAYRHMQSTGAHESYLSPQRAALAQAGYRFDDKGYYIAEAALAPTSQPSRGKCETCNDTGKVRGWRDPHWPVSSSGAQLGGYEVEKPCPDCPAGATSSIDYAQRVGHEKLKADCAQPERQGARAGKWICSRHAEPTKGCDECYSFWRNLMEGIEPPSPPPTDDTELVRLLVNVKDLLGIYEGRVDGTISRIDRAIAALKGDKGWQPIETAPKDGRDILLCNLNWRPFMGRYVTAGDSGWFVDARGGQREPAYWQPMPSPPLGAS